MNIQDRIIMDTRFLLRDIPPVCFPMTPKTVHRPGRTARYCF